MSFKYNLNLIFKFDNKSIYLNANFTKLVLLNTNYYVVRGTENRADILLKKHEFTSIFHIIYSYRMRHVFIATVGTWLFYTYINIKFNQLI